MDDIAEIQAELDEVFPGTRLQYVPLWGYWIITDYLQGVDGSPATAYWYPTPWNLMQLEEGDMTNRKVVFILSHPDSGEPIEPSCENVLNTMYRAYTGGNYARIQQWIDEVDQKEQGVKEYHKQVERDMNRDAARTAFDRHHGKIISTGAATTNMADTDRFISQQMTEQHEHDMVSAQMSQRRDAVRQGAARDGMLAGY